MTLQSVSAKTDAETFVDFLFEGQEGYVYAPTKDPNKEPKDAWEQNFFKWPEDRAALLAHFIGSSPTLDVYVAPAIFESPDAHKEFVRSSTTYWCEFDGVVPTVLDNIPEPSMRVRSSESGREHWYWKLADAATQMDTVESINRALALKLHADSSGWDCNQVLRPPNTINHKRGKPVSLIGIGQNRYSEGDFGHVPRVPVLVMDADFLSIPDALDTVAKYKWPAVAWRVFREKAGADRSDSLMNLGYHCAEMGMSNAEIYSIIRNADDRWGKFVGRADRERRLLDVVNIARNKYPLGNLESSANISLPVFGLKSLLASEVEVEWLIPEVLSKNGSMMITGPSGVGKTQFSLRCAMNLALGNTFCDWKITGQSKVLFFSLEMGHQDLKYFLFQMVQSLSPSQMDLLESNLLLVPLGESIPLDTEAGQSLVEGLIAEHRPVGFFWDSLGSATDESLGEEKVKKLDNWSQRMRNKYDCFAWYIHHQRKGQAQNKKPKTQDDVYGSQYIVARQTSIYCLWDNHKGDSTLELIPLKVRMAKQKPPIEIIRTSDLDFYVKPTAAYQPPRKKDIETLSGGIFDSDQPPPMMEI